MLADLPANGSSVQVGSLVQCEINNFTDWYFLAPVGGGITVTADGNEVTVLTANSPLGSQLLGSPVNGSVALPTGGSGTIISLI